MPIILLVTDDAALRHLVDVSMRSQQYDCRHAASGEAALEAVDLIHPDVVLLSLDLRGDRGAQLCSRLRARVRIPILALSRHGGDRYKVAALDAGADDYIVTPFSTAELLARLRVALRHRKALASVVDDSVIEVGELRIDTSEHIVAIGRRLINLTPKEFQLLVLLARNAGKVLAHRTILDLIWPSAQSADTLRLHISQLRKKLGTDAGTPQLTTESGVGYSLAAPTR